MSLPPESSSTGEGPRSVAREVEAVRHRIASATDRPEQVRLVAVTKGFGVEAARAALAAGVTDLGENYADELVAKSAALEEVPGAGAPSWHFLGALQRNKVPRLAPLVDWWQSVARVVEGRAIARRRPGARVLVQVEVTGRQGRNGCPPDRLEGVVRELSDLDLEVAGLMAVGPQGPPDAVRSAFRLVASWADRLELRERSMGMSDDLELAVAEGSTMVRVGRALFGDRPPRRPPPG